MLLGCAIAYAVTPVDIIPDFIPFIGHLDDAAFLGFEPDQITVLIKNRLLKPLGRPAPTGDKFFAKIELDKLKADKEWLSKVTLAVTDYWKAKNARKSKAANQTPKADVPPA